jgi:hypothetical protein
MYTSVPDTDVSSNYVNQSLTTNLADLDMRGALQFGGHIAYIFGMSFFFFCDSECAMAFITKCRRNLQQNEITSIRMTLHIFSLCFLNRAL